MDKDFEKLFNEEMMCTNAQDVIAFANTVKSYFDALTGVGFTRQEALALITALMTDAKKKE